MNWILVPRANRAAQAAVLPTSPFPMFKAAVSAQKAGTRNARMLLIGDSTTMGLGSNINGSDFNGQPASYPAQLAALLTNGSAQSRIGNNAASGTYGGMIAFGSGWGTSNNIILGAQFFLSSPSATGALAFTPTVQTNSLDIYYVQISGFDTFKVDVNGGSSLGTTNTSGTTALVKVTYTATKGSNTWNITPVSPTNGVFIHSLVAHDTTGPKVIDVLDAGWSGGNAANLTSDLSNPYAAIPSLSVYQPDLTIICLTINDIINQSNVSTFSANTQLVITGAQATGDVLLMSGVQSDPSTYAVDGTAYRAVYDSLAASNGLLHLNLINSLGNYATLTAAGLMSDTIHPNGSQASDGKGGYGAIAALVKTTIASAL